MRRRCYPRFQKPKSAVLLNRHGHTLSAAIIGSPLHVARLHCLTALLTNSPPWTRTPLRCWPSYGAQMEHVSNLSLRRKRPTSSAGLFPDSKLRVVAWKSPEISDAFTGVD